MTLDPDAIELVRRLCGAEQASVLVPADPAAAPGSCTPRVICHEIGGQGNLKSMSTVIGHSPARSSGSPEREPTALRARLRPRALVLPGLLLVVVAQVLINYHTWLISGPDHLYYLRGLEHHPLPYIDTRIEYPVLTGVFMTVSSGLTHGLTDYLRLNSVLLGACAVGCTITLWSISRRAACIFALCPLLLVYSLANWDLFAILLMLLGWRAYLRRRHATAGVWLALGVFAKLFPIFLLGACLLGLAKRWRTTGERRARNDLARFGAGAMLASAVVNLPFAIPAFRSWIWFWTFNQQRNGNSDLLHALHVLTNATSVTTTNHVLTAIVLVAVVVGAVAIWRGVPIARVAALVFLVFMVMNKIYSPQYTLWVFVYALLADWDLWAIVALSLIGLVDDAAAAVHIALVNDHAPKALAWYGRNIVPREQDFRLLGMIAPGAAMLSRELRATDGDAVKDQRPVAESRARST